MVAPASTGLGVMVALFTTGVEVSRVTVRVTEDALPAASVAVMTMVFVPFASVRVFVKEPSVPTVIEGEAGVCGGAKVIDER